MIAESRHLCLSMQKQTGVNPVQAGFTPVQYVRSWLLHETDMTCSKILLVYQVAIILRLDLR